MIHKTWPLLVAASTLSLVCSFNPLRAEVQAQGRGEIAFKPGAFSSKPDEQVRRKAMDDARKNALIRYASSFPQSKYELFEKASPQILSQLDQYVVDAIVSDEGINKETKTYYVIVRATINDAKLENALNAQGIAAAQAAPGGKASISFLFVARETESVKSFDARRTSVSNSQAAVSATQTQALAGGAAHLNESSETTSTVTTGGSTLRKADETSYRVTSPENMNTAMNDVFSSRGIEVYDYRDVVSQCGGVDPDKVYAEFSKGDELSRDTRSTAFAAARKCDIGAFAIGTLDIGLQDVDPVSGNKRVYVSVRSQLLDISGKLPRIIASVGPVQYAGLGPEQAVAMRNALTLAATEVAKTMTDQLNAKGLR